MEEFNICRQCNHISQNKDNHGWKNLTFVDSVTDMVC